MRAVVYAEFREQPRISELPIPPLDPDAALVRVRATGLCRSDWHGWMGHDPDIQPPHVPGHEFAGIVEQMGAAVQTWKPGDRVTAPFVCGCGDCPQCRAGNAQICDHQTQPGFTHWGSFAEFVVVRQADLNLVRLPESMDFDTAASLGCRFATAFRAVVDQGRVEAGQRVAIFGCGGVGLSAVMIATALGARVFAVDVTPEALALARELGAVAAIDARERDPVASIRDLSAGGAHVSLDAFGNSKTLHQSVSCLRKGGRHVQVGLMVADESEALVPMGRVLADELEIVGSHGIQATRYEAIFDLIERHALEPERLIGRRIGLDEVPDALVRLAEGIGPGITVVQMDRPA